MHREPAEVTFVLNQAGGVMCAIARPPVREDLQWGHATQMSEKQSLTRLPSTMT